MESKLLLVLLCASLASAQLDWDDSEWTPILGKCENCQKARLVSKKTHIGEPRSLDYPTKREAGGPLILPGELFAYKSLRDVANLDQEASRVQLVYVPEGSIEDLQSANLARVTPSVESQARPPRQVIDQAPSRGRSFTSQPNSNFNQQSFNHLEPRRPAALVAQVGHENIAQQQIQLLEAALSSQQEIPTNGQLPRVFIAPTHIPPPPGYVKIPLIPNQSKLNNQENVPGTFLTSDVRETAPPGFIQLPLPQSVAHLSNNIPFVIPDSQHQIDQQFTNEPGNINHFVARPPPPPPPPALRSFNERHNQQRFPQQNQDIFPQPNQEVFPQQNLQIFPQQTHQLFPNQQRFQQQQNHQRFPQNQQRFPQPSVLPEHQNHRFSSPSNNEEPDLERPEHRLPQQVREQVEHSSSSFTDFPQQEDDIPTNEGPSSFRQLSEPHVSLPVSGFSSVENTPQNNQLFEQGKTLGNRPEKTRFIRPENSHRDSFGDDVRPLDAFDPSTSFGSGNNFVSKDTLKPFPELRPFVHEDNFPVFPKSSVETVVETQTNSPIEDSLATEAPFHNIESEIKTFAPPRETTFQPEATFPVSSSFDNVGSFNVGDSVVPTSQEISRTKPVPSSDLSKKRKGSFTRDFPRPSLLENTGESIQIPTTTFRPTVSRTKIQDFDVQTEPAIFVTEAPGVNAVPETTTETVAVTPRTRRPNIRGQQSIRSRNRTRNRHRFNNNVSRDPIRRPVNDVTRRRPSEPIEPKEVSENENKISQPEPTRPSRRRRVRVKGRRKKPNTNTVVLNIESEDNTNAIKVTPEVPSTTTSTTTELPPSTAGSTLLPPFSIASKRSKTEQKTEPSTTTRRRPPPSRNQFGSRVRTRPSTVRRRKPTKVNEVTDSTPEPSNQGKSISSASATPARVRKVGKRRRVRVKAGRPLPEWLLQQRKNKDKASDASKPAIDEDSENKLSTTKELPDQVAQSSDPVEGALALLGQRKTPVKQVVRRRRVKVSRKIPKPAEKLVDNETGH